MQAVRSLARKIVEQGKAVEIIEGRCHITERKILRQHSIAELNCHSLPGRIILLSPAPSTTETSRADVAFIRMKNVISQPRGKSLKSFSFSTKLRQNVATPCFQLRVVRNSERFSVDSSA